MSGFQKNVSGQKWLVFAFDATDNTPVTGDAANITAKLRKDYGTATATNDTNPTEIEDGYYEFDLTQAETNANVLDLLPESSTSDVQVIGVPARVFTVAENFNALGIESDGHAHADLKEWKGAAPADLDTDKVQASGDWNTTTPLDAAGVRSAVGLASADLDTQLGAMSTHSAADVWSVTTRVLTANTNLNDPTAAAIRAEIDSNSTQLAAILEDTGTTIPAQITGLNDFDPASDTVANVTTVGTVTNVVSANVTQIGGQSSIDGETVLGWFQIVGAGIGGDTTSGGTVFKGIGNSTTRITTSIDGSGNRSNTTST